LDCESVIRSTLCGVGSSFFGQTRGGSAHIRGLVVPRPHPGRRTPDIPGALPK